VNEFFDDFQETQRSKSHRNSLPVISHITLLVGCAWTIWLRDSFQSTNLPTNNHKIMKCLPMEQLKSNPIEYLSGFSSFSVLEKDFGFAKESLFLPFLGLLTVGVGDAMASVLGSLYGVIRWPNSQRTVYGTFSSMLSMMIVAFLIFFLVPFSDQHDNLLARYVPIIGTIMVTSLMEAFTKANDNLVLPLYSSSVYLSLEIIFSAKKNTSTFLFMK
jgi:hypothetical protein